MSVVTSLIGERYLFVREIAIEKAIRWGWHLDPDRRVRFVMVCRLPSNSYILAGMTHDPDAQIAAMAYDRSTIADMTDACRHNHFLVRQAGIAKTWRADLVKKALRDDCMLVRETAKSRLAADGSLKRVV